MTDSKYHTPESHTLEGRTFRPASLAETVEAVEEAFDYRGDITLLLKSGQSVTGYVFNREARGAAPYFEIFPQDQAGSRTVPYADVVSIAFTGEDTASGQSWETWVAKKESDRRAEAQRVAEAAQARGHL